MNAPDDLLYSKEHEWILNRNDVATLGITDHAQKELGDVVFVDLPHFFDLHLWSFIHL